MSSDAWLLLSILYSEGETEAGASLSSIIATADYINHAILTYKELRDGLARLQIRGCIKEHDERYRATRSMRTIFARFTRPGRPVWKDLADVERYLNSRGFDVVVVSTRLIQPIERTAYENAVEAYLQRMQPPPQKTRHKRKTNHN